MTETMHAPYHFIPLSKWVYMPPWAHLVSHDVPFEDGLSGRIQLTLTNHSPLCVGGDQSRLENDVAKVFWARDPLGRPIIPGSSVKGVLREVMEIATFGKFNAVDDQKLSYRDISKSKNYYLTEVIDRHKTVAGWLKFNSDTRQWEFRQCKFAKIKHNVIREGLNKTIRNDSSAVEKYKTIPLVTALDATVEGVTADDKLPKVTQVVRSDNKQGRIVFTNKRIVNTKKAKPEDYEFSYYFYDVATNAHTNIDAVVAELFESNNEEQVEYLKKHADPNLGIPVFSLQDQGKIAYLGFAKMPRINYKNSFHELIHKHSPAHLSDAYFDFAELIFGTLRDHESLGSELGLKGRVFFSDLTLEENNSAKLYWSAPLVLNGPKASFYPAYLEQTPGTNSLMDYNADNAKLSGRKRYIAQFDDKGERLGTDVSNGKVNVASKLELLPKQNQFSGELVFHNLKPEELGALLWTIRLGQTASNDCLHSLGHGKPYGAGLVSFDIDLWLRDQGQVDYKTYMSDFESHMNKAYPSSNSAADGWLNSTQLTHLRELSNPSNNEGLDTSYMSLDGKEFQKAKNGKLPNHQHFGTKRGENINEKDAVSLAFGQGRLSYLVTADDHWASEQKQAVDEKNKKLQQQKQAEAEKQAREQEQKKLREELGECGFYVTQLKDDLTMMEQSAKPELLRAAIQQFLEKSGEYQASSAQKLFDLARQHEFHKNPKKRREEHKELLNALLAAYGLTAPQ